MGNFWTNAILLTQASSDSGFDLWPTPMIQEGCKRANILSCSPMHQYWQNKLYTRGIISGIQYGGQLSVEILHLSTEAKSYDSHPLHENYVNIYGGWPDTICQSIALLGSIGLAWWDRVITCLRLIDHLHSQCRAPVNFLEVISEINSEVLALALKAFPNNMPLDSILKSNSLPKKGPSFFYSSG